MRGFSLICMLGILLSGCSTNKDELYQKSMDFMSKPLLGYNRSELFSSYAPPLSGYVNPMCTMLQTRKDWTRAKEGFRERYPHYNVELLTFNQISKESSFTWQERVIIADALDLLMFAINSPVFQQQMLKRNFYTNNRTSKLSAEEVVRRIKTIPIKMIVGKASLGENVLAEATVGGGVNHMWLRNDTCYTKYNVTYLAMIMGHELAHNMGFKHETNVPYGVHNPILAALYTATKEEVKEFQSLTPYYEDEFLLKTRALDSV